jgi:hypothetical protein
MNAARHATTITPEELSENLADILRRAREDHERFVVQQGDDILAFLEPPVQRKGITVSELIARIGNLEMPGDGFADDLEEVQRLHRMPSNRPPD